ncbi:MAG: multicopper oxidase domain-containing protein, partial [Planctomycetota bacterium]
AHKHGATAQQVANGLIGPLIVADPPGLMPGYISNAKEQIFMFTTRGAVLVMEDGGGELRPTVRLRPGEVQRWRIINSRPTRDAFANIQVDEGDLEIWQIAFDGYTLHNRIKVDSKTTAVPWMNPAGLAPGNRVDLLVRAKSNAKSQSLKLSAQPAELVTPHKQDGLSTLMPVDITVEIDGEPVNHEWSEEDALPGPGIDIPFHENITSRTLDFSDLMGRFVIDGVAFDGAVKHTVRLGSVEEWTIRNFDVSPHPFHIHVNPFFVTHINGKLTSDSPLRRWQDTISIPPRVDDNPGSVTFLTHFKNFRGKFVFHCHILSHEDAGMMQIVEVV